MDLGFVICYWAGAVTGDVWTTRRGRREGGTGGRRGRTHARASERVIGRHGGGTDMEETIRVWRAVGRGWWGAEAGAAGSARGKVDLDWLAGGWVHEEGAGDYRGR